MKKKARDLQIGEKIIIGGKICTVISKEISDIGKQGMRKCRLELKTAEGEKVVIIRPEDYPFDIA